MLSPTMLMSAGDDSVMVRVTRWFATVEWAPAPNPLTGGPTGTFTIDRQNTGS